MPKDFTVNNKILNILKIFWRVYLKFYRCFFSLLTVFFLLAFFPFLLLLSFSSRGKGKGFFVGLREISGNVYNFKNALSLKEDVYTVILYSPIYSEKNYDKILKYPKIFDSFINIKRIYIEFLFIKEFIFNINKYEYFVFFWKTSFFPFNLDYFFLKIAKKKIGVFYCGDDVRYRPIHRKVNESMSRSYRVLPLLESDHFIFSFLGKLWPYKMASWFDCKIFSARSDLTFLDKAIYHFLLSQKNLVSSKKAQDIPTILHAPTDRAFKETHKILEAIELLKKEKIKFNFVLLENVKNKVVLEHLKKSDILIDQVGFCLGSLGLEGLASSCVVIGGNDMDYVGYDIKLPVIRFPNSAHELSNILRWLILDKDKRQKLMRESLKACKEYYAPENFCSRILQIFSDGIKPDLLPFENHKKMLLSCTENVLQKLCIYLLVKK